MVDFVRVWSDKTELPAETFIRRLGIARGKFFAWKERYGKANEHNAQVPRDFWVEDWERQAIVDYHDRNPLEGYRRLAFMMIDQDVVAVSPATVYRVLKKAGRLDRWNRRASKKGTGFVQPLRPHAHWHVDISYINVAGTFFYLCSVLDGYSRVIVHWDLRAAMPELAPQAVQQAALALVLGGAAHSADVGQLLELAPLDDFGRRNLGALNIEFRAEGDWRAA